ncbi:hypothetical protein FB451DRAFT_1529283 [Mycena latifolia]|nr:hypothetical protein FB451DRAFT_1529283 [Mycena latifolia]
MLTDTNVTSPARDPTLFSFVITMHPSLSLSNIQKLPSSLKELALVASKEPDSPSQADLRSTTLSQIYMQLHDLLDGNRRPTVSQLRAARLLLPLFHGILDPEKIRQEMEHDATTMLIGRTALRALWVLSKHSLVDVVAIPEIWPRTWAYIQLHHRHVQSRSAHDADAAIICATHLNLIWALAFDSNPHHEIPHPVIDATPGLRQLLAELWERATESQHFRDISAAPLHQLLLYFTAVRTNPSHLEELVEGAGGSLASLGALIVKYLDALATEVMTAMPPKLLGYVAFIAETVVEHGQLLDACANQGLLRALTHLMVQLTEVQEDVRPSVAFEVCVHSLSKAIGAGVGYPKVIEAIRSGFLFSIFQLGARGISEQGRSDLRALGGILCRYLIYYPVLRSVERALAELDETQSTPSICRRSAVWNEWSTFLELVEERLDIKADFDVHYTSQKFCDNIAVCRPSPLLRSPLMVHSAKTFRISRTSVDALGVSPFIIVQRPAKGKIGRRGIAQLANISATSSSLEDDEEAPTNAIRPKAKAFLRHLLHDDYLRDKQSIFRDRVKFMAQSSKPFYTEFDYTEGEVAI